MAPTPSPQTTACRSASPTSRSCGCAPTRRTASGAGEHAPHAVPAHSEHSAGAARTPCASPPRWARHARTLAFAVPRRDVTLGRPQVLHAPRAPTARARPPRVPGCDAHMCSPPVQGRARTGHQCLWFDYAPLAQQNAWGARARVCAFCARARSALRRAVRRRCRQPLRASWCKRTLTRRLSPLHRCRLPPRQGWRWAAHPQPREAAGGGASRVVGNSCAASVPRL